MTPGGKSDQPHSTVQTGDIKNEGGQVNVAGRDNIIQNITNFFRGDTDQQRSDKNRQNMLQLVWNTWIEGLLKKSLYNEVLIELGMETRPDAVDHPWDMLVQMPDRAPEMLPAGVKMLDVFDQSGGSLLILGEPGAGKTTMLLELCRQAIERASVDPTQPIPVVFNLSSWTSGVTLVDWIVGELKNRYYVSDKIGKPWVEQDKMLLLLDGLDEVKADQREACVGAINDFREEHGAPVVVCSRVVEYQDLAVLLRMGGAVMIQPLSERQVDEYLTKAGSRLTAVHQLLKRDQDLREFAQTPLILSIMVLAYRDATDDDLQALEDSGDYRGRLFDAYIDQMFRRRGVGQKYKPEDVQRWLRWLAGQMMERAKE